MIDRNGMELAFGGLNAVLRDYARFEVVSNGQQVVPREWDFSDGRLAMLAAQRGEGRHIKIGLAHA